MELNYKTLRFTVTFFFLAALLITSTQGRALDGLMKRAPPTQKVGESEWGAWYGRRELPAKVTKMLVST